MIYRAAIPVNVSSTDVVLARACTALYIGTGGAGLAVDMATPTIPIINANAIVTGINQSTGAITALTLTYGGKGYTTGPKVTIYSPYGGTGANITANLTSDAVTSFTISSGGTGYNLGSIIPTVQFSGGGNNIDVVFPAVIAGILPISVTKIYHSGTSATGIVALYESIGSTVFNGNV